MMIRNRTGCWLFLGMLSWNAASSVNLAGDEPKLPFQTSTKHDSDRITAKVEPQRWIISIRSPIGISHASIKRLGDTWPEQISLRFYLRGLENLQIAFEQTKLELAVPSMRDATPIHQWQDGDEKNQLTPSSEYWLKVQRVEYPSVENPSPAGSTMPTSDSYFDIQLPAQMLRSNPKLISLTWVDFYRS